jgi:hypothetical protein
MDDALRNSPTHQAMFVSAMRVAFADPEARKAFEEDTGKPAYAPPADALGAHIDAKTGYARQSLVDFATWFAKTQWGEAEAPDIEALFRQDA